MSYARFLMGSGLPDPLQLPLKKFDKLILKSRKQKRAATVGYATNIEVGYGGQ